MPSTGKPIGGFPIYLLDEIKISITMYAGGPNMDAAHKRELKKMLEEHRRKLSGEVREKIRAGREETASGGKSTEVLDTVDGAVAEVQGDLDFALAQMKSETLTKVNDALKRLEQGKYGYCFECEEKIAVARLRSLPFAVRCKDCEEAKEAAEERRRGRF